MNKYPTTEEIRKWPNEMLLDVYTEISWMTYEENVDHDTLLYKGKLRHEVSRRMEGKL